MQLVAMATRKSDAISLMPETTLGSRSASFPLPQGRDSPSMRLSSRCGRPFLAVPGSPPSSRLSLARAIVPPISKTASRPVALAGAMREPTQAFV
jgi:hypothetical protein